MPTKAEIVNQIEEQIIPNLMELITGGILQNVLLGMVDQINTLVGELDDLNTDDRSSIVNAINELVSNIQAIEDNLTPYVYFGIDDPNIVTPVGFGGDIPSFYVQQQHSGLDVVNIGFWTYTGIFGKEWVDLSLEGVGGIQSIQEGDNISIDNTDPQNPIISSDGGIPAAKIFNKTNNELAATMMATDKYLFGVFGKGADPDFSNYYTPITVTTPQHIYILKDNVRTKPVLLTSVLFDIATEGKVSFERWKITGSTATRVGMLYTTYPPAPVFPIGINEVLANESLGTILQPDEFIAIRMQGSTHLLGRVTSSAVANPNYITYRHISTTITDIALGTPLDLSLGIQYRYRVLGEITESNNDVELQDLVAVGGDVYLSAKEYIVTRELLVPSNTTIRGVKGKTIIRYTGTGDFIKIKEGSNHIAIENIIFDGGNTITKAVTNPTDVKTLAGRGTQNCITINGISKNIHINRCVIRRFNGCGFYATNTHQNNVYTETFKITNNVINNCFVGVMLDSRAEYHHLSENTISNNQIGFWCEGGNNYGSTNHFNANSVGVVLSGQTGVNDTHGSIANSSINHNITYSIFAIDVNNGYSFTGCQIFQGSIYIENSKGVIITGGIIAANILVANEGPGFNIIAFNIFANSYGGGVIGANSKLSMSGNRFIEGTDSSALNNSI